MNPVRSQSPAGKESKENLTPVMKQYEQLKAGHPGEILLFRLGDFYEVFGEDAKSMAPVLEVTLTQRQGVPMCGIPYHALGRYVAKLLKKNVRVAIAEQMEDPATTKGIVKRDVIRVISPGTITEVNLLGEKLNNFLVALAFSDGEGRPSVGLAALDISTGQFIFMQFQDDSAYSTLANEITRINPAEILLCEDTHPVTSHLDGIPAQLLIRTDYEFVDPAKIFPYGSESALEDLRSYPLSLEAVRMVLHTLQRMNAQALETIQPPRRIVNSEIMTLDRETLENLEILKNREDGSSDKTLLSFLDRTLTPMGGRLLRQMLVRPLIHLEKIKERLETVEFYVRESAQRGACRKILKGSADLERIIARVISGGANPRDLLSLKNVLIRVRESKETLAPPKTEGPGDIFAPNMPGLASNILSRLRDCPELTALIHRAIAEEPPIHLEESGAIRAGYDAALDDKRRAAHEGKVWLQELESREREATRIQTLKIGYTSVFGYYFDVTKPHLSKVPQSWHRKQTLINAERFVSEELKDLEQKILGAEEQCLRIERQIFKSIVESVKERSGEVQRTAEALAELDCFLSLAEVAEVHSLAKPELDSSDILSVTDGWHPIVKESLPSGMFVPNDTDLNGTSDQIIILTGPNMSGKSTYLRQTALIALIAQTGSYVPAKSARIGIVDRIFTRIGSGDRLAQGQSTFMVEMQETAKILNNVTSRSLVILDEVGRGTSTYDGISIAWAVIEHLARIARPKVLFATHYFELTHLAGELEGVRNYNVQAKEWKNTVIFLHKIARGPADRSYGIHVAQLAGLPPAVILRAKKILEKLEKEHISLLQSKEESRQGLFEL